jgi:anaerobic ribonucleoside-triphosphate reductase activating protein
MRYHQFYPIDVVNGAGTRCTLFVTGCEHRCRGCYNKTTWNPDKGHLFTKELEDAIINMLNDVELPRRGLTLSGGDPLFEANLESVLHLVNRVKTETTKDIWLWTGFTLKDALLHPVRAEILKRVDTIIDGKFVKELADPSLKWRGSSNQCIYDVEDSGFVIQPEPARPVNSLT